MAEFLTEDDDKEYQEISQDAKDIVQNKPILKLMKFSRSQIQCSASRVTTTQLQGSPSCRCGLMLLEASDEVKK